MKHKAPIVLPPATLEIIGEPPNVTYKIRRGRTTIIVPPPLKPLPKPEPIRKSEAVANAAPVKRRPVKKTKKK